VSDRVVVDIVVEYIFGDLWEPGKTRRMTVPFSRLTARAAREILFHAVKHTAFSPSGAVWWPDGGYGYRVYRHSMRKIHKRWQEADGE
jgi:hypothetical protein